MFVNLKKPVQFELTLTYFLQNVYATWLRPSLSQVAHWNYNIFSILE